MGLVALNLLIIIPKSIIILCYNHMLMTVSSQNYSNYYILMMRPQFILKYLHFDIKFDRALYHVTDRNLNSLEVLYHTVYDLWINDPILYNKHYTCCLQGTLLILVKEGRIKKDKIIKRFLDFIVYHNQECRVDEGGVEDTWVAFIIKIKHWLVLETIQQRSTLSIEEWSLKLQIVKSDWLTLNNLHAVYYDQSDDINEIEHGGAGSVYMT